MNSSLEKRKIRTVVARWLRASSAGRVEQILPLMAEDVVFLRPGHPPMRGRDAFAKNFRTAMRSARFSAKSTVEEIEILGGYAYCWINLAISMTPANGGATHRRRGDILSIYRKERDGSWVLFRDANML
ncbi:MAG: SgcJ/EcaC family oxidoreductase [Verrucomicrobia bacterium]|nr:SgcJ/EcaC family oxidoreductase [Verrucomicrobiota bacterium]